MSLFIGYSHGPQGVNLLRYTTIPQSFLLVPISLVGGQIVDKVESPPSVGKVSNYVIVKVARTLEYVVRYNTSIRSSSDVG